MDQFRTDYETLNDLLEAPSFEPNPERRDWQRPQVDALSEAYRLLLAAHRHLKPDFADEVEAIAVSVAIAGGEVAAVLAASGRGTEARDLVDSTSTAAPDSAVKRELSAAKLDMTSFVAINYGRWLTRQNRRREAAEVLRPVIDRASDELLRAAAKAVLDAPRPISRAPSLSTFYGFGLRMAGRRDERGDTHVSNHCLTAAYIPIIPLSAYRVTNHGDGSFTFFSKEKLSSAAIWWRRAVLTSALVIAAVIGLQVYLNSPDRLARKAADDAAALAKRGDVTGALRAYERVLRKYDAEASRGVLDGIAARLIKLHAGQVKSPLTVDRVEQAERVVRRLAALHVRARGNKARSAMVAGVFGWVAQLGTASPGAMHAALRLLEAVLPEARGETKAIVQRIAGLRLALADRLAAEWPLAAIDTYLEVTGSVAAITRAGEVLGKVASDSSLLVAAEPRLRTWLSSATKTSPANGDRVAALTAAMNTARVGAASLAKEITAAGDDAMKLGELLAKHPKDQSLVSSVAAQRLRAGDAKAAVKLLAELGKPGWLIPAAQELLAQAYSQTGQLERADALLSQIVSLSLPRYLAVSQRYNKAASELHSRLVALAERGGAPADVSAALRSRDQQRAREAFSRWEGQRLDADPTVSALRKQFTGHGHVVSLSVSLGMIKLRRANKATGRARTKLLAGAERTFLAIRQDAAGLPSYHLGLGRVYHRLGRAKDGDKEFDGLLARDNPELTLAVARAYRELGMVARARTICEGVYKRGVAPHHYEAAMTLAIMEHDLEKREAWLKKADQQAPFVRTMLLALQARLLFRDGKYRQADAKMAVAAKRDEEAAKHNGVAANNAALSYQFRYSCTGDKRHLERAVTLLEQALRLSPDNALVLANLAEVHGQVGRLTVLRGLLRVDVLRLTAEDAASVIARLRHSDQGRTLLRAMRSDPSIIRNEMLLRQQQVLRPTDSSAFTSLASLYWARDEHAKLTEMRDALRARTLAFEPPDPKELAAYYAGQQDDKLLADADRQVVSARRTVERVTRLGHKATLAVAWLSQGRAHLSRARLSQALGDTTQAIAAFRRAAELLPALAADQRVAWALVTKAIIRTAGVSPAFRARWDKERRRYSPAIFLHRLQSDPTAAGLVAALRSQAELAQAATLFAASTRPARAWHWVLGRLAKHKALETKGLGAFTRPGLAATVEIGALLRPDSDENKANFALYKQRR